MEKYTVIILRPDGTTEDYQLEVNRTSTIKGINQKAIKLMAVEDDFKASELKAVAIVEGWGVVLQTFDHQENRTVAT